MSLFLKFRHSYSVANEEFLRSEVSKLWIELDTKIQSCLVSENSLTPNNQAPVTNEEFRNRQTENQIKSDAKVNISLAWNNRADLDLSVKQPDGIYATQDIHATTLVINHSKIFLGAIKWQLALTKSMSGFTQLMVRVINLNLFHSQFKLPRMKRQVPFQA